jgi:hypothetical protein
MQSVITAALAGVSPESVYGCTTTGDLLMMTTDLPATTRLDAILLPESRFPWRLTHRRWERDLYVLRYQDASDPRQDEGPEPLAIFASEADALAFADDGPIVPLSLEHLRQRIAVQPSGKEVVTTITAELPL